MSIICYLLSPRGYCVGVQRAVNMVNQVLKLYKQIYIIEDIIHNKPFMDNMLKQGMIKVDSLSDIPDGSAVMFSAHGVSPKILEQATQRELTVIDATCPEVRELQNKVKEKAELGYSIIIIGNRAHQEVISLLDYKDDIFVVNNDTDIELLPDISNSNIVYFTQTSMCPEDVKVIVDALKRKLPNIKSDTFDNICQATLERQKVIKAIAPKIDLLLVIGSNYSSNTVSLLRTGTIAGIKQIIRIDTKDDIRNEMFENVKSIAVTASTSTSELLVTDVINYLQSKLDIKIEEFKVKNDN